MVDIVVTRKELRPELVKVISILRNTKPAATLLTLDKGK